MARFDRCEICDYTQADGSAVAGVGPRAHGKVRLRYGQMLCDVCEGSVVGVMVDFAIADLEKEQEQAQNGTMESSTPTVPLRSE